MPDTLPFLFGAQYYRAPTPEPECWPADIARMKELGFNAVKYWVQWRWSHRSPDRFVFDDVDRLMDLARQNDLQVTLNVIFDVAPVWLYDRYPDAKQVLNDGTVVEPYTVGHRQIGGHPGPCYNHPGALAERQRFMAATVEHYRGHPVLAMWDVWNEPELCFPQRTPKVPTLACYCPHCRRAFLAWLKRKYGTVERLNAVWGRWYDAWDEVELPRDPHTFTDFVDWREFHNDTMTAEAAWRLAMARELDPGRVRYLHVVPNTMALFNSVSCCADDFALARECDVFAATTSTDPVAVQQVLSGGHGKVCYNVESHINGGMTSLHQRRIDLNDLLADFLPQIGLGIKGFLFWQYRPEVLGFESPAWGLVAPDGTDRPATRAIAAFWERLAPHTDALMRCSPRPARVGIWKSRKNEIFHFAMHGKLDSLVQSVEAYARLLYWQSVPYRFVDADMLARGSLDGLRLLILPSPYYLTEDEAISLDAWVRSGGVLLSEAHLGGYNATTGRHSRVVPGCGLAQAWGIRESESTSSFHLKLDRQEAFFGAITDDLRKALAASGTTGGQHFPIRMSDGAIGHDVVAWGGSRYVTLAGDSIMSEGAFEPSAPCLASLSVGDGFVFYAGTNLGQGSQVDATGLSKIVSRLLALAGISPTLLVQWDGPGQIHLDALCDDSGPRFLMLRNRSSAGQRITLEWQGAARGLFSGSEWRLDGSMPVDVPPGFVDLFVLER
jgi:beta-galactosidase